jgi:hypothetical protein
MHPFTYLIVMAGITMLILVPLFVSSTSETSKIIFSVLCWIPYVISGRKIYVHVSEISRHKHKERLTLLDVVIYSFVFMASGALLFVNFWLYAPDSWETLNDPNMTTIIVWLRFIATSLLVATGGEFTALKPQWWYAEDVVALFAFISWTTFIIMVGAFTIPYIYDQIKKEDEEEPREPLLEQSQVIREHREEKASSWLPARNQYVFLDS